MANNNQVFNPASFLGIGICEPIEINATNLKKVINQNPFNLISAIITPDGKYYPSIATHEDILLYLEMQGVDLEGTLRISEVPAYDKKPSELSLSGFDFLAKYRSIYLTEAQAVTLLDFYDALREVRKKRPTLGKFLRDADNFGWCMDKSIMSDEGYYSNVHAEHNIKLMQFVVSRKYDLTKVNRRDLEFFGLLDEVIKDNNFKRPKALREKQKTKVFKDISTFEF